MYINSDNDSIRNIIIITINNIKNINNNKAKQNTFAGVSKKSELPPTITTFREPKKVIPGQDELDIFYVGNLSEDNNKSDLFELFGICTINHLRDNSDVQIPLSENTGKRLFK